MDSFAFKIHSICTPFSYLTLPSYDIASIKAFLVNNNVEMSVDMMYMRYAEYVGGELYSLLHEKGGGELVFSALLFPGNRSRLYDVWSHTMGTGASDFDAVIELTDEFCNSFIEERKDIFVDIKNVHFHLYTKSLMSSLYIAKLIYERFKSEIWVSGYHCQNECGESLKVICPFIKKVISTDTERNILKELTNIDKYSEDLDYIPTPNYDDFIKSYNYLSKEFKDKYLTRYLFQVEFNRGCWWDKCTFCTLNCQYTSFQERSIDNLVNTYKEIIKKYKTFQIIVYERNSGPGWKEIIEAMDDRIPEMKGSYTLSFKVSYLSNPDDIKFLSDHRVKFLVGTECFSGHLLDKINKEQRVIDNIFMLKFSERYGAQCYHNFMYSLPFETEEDFIETEKNINKILHLIPPFDLEEFRLTYNSEIYKRYEDFNISKIKFRNIEYTIIPPNFHEKIHTFFYDFEVEDIKFELRKSKWIKLIDEWRNKYYQDEMNGVPNRGCKLSMRSDEEFLEIYDSRYSTLNTVYSYSDFYMKIYQYCDVIRAFNDIVVEFNTVNEENIRKCLDDFISKNLMFKEGEDYLSLAV